MNATINIILRKKIRKDGKYPIALRITKNKKSKYITLNMYCLESEFINGQLKKSIPNFRKKNQILLKQKTKALGIIDDYVLEGVDFTLDDFETKFRGVNTNHEANAIGFFNEIIDEMIRSGRIGNANAYKETKESLVKFSGDTIYFKNMTPAFLEKFEVFLRERGNKNGGIAFKMREVRALLNKAINRGIISQESYPFKAYKISKLRLTKNKRALRLDEFKRIRDLDLAEHSHLLEAHNYFLFSFYTRGMNFADMMMLKWSDIQNGRIYYTRLKTKGQFNIEIVEKVQFILDFYKAQNRTTGYVFPIILRTNLTPQQLANRRHKVISRINKKLKEIGELAKIDTPITSYVARHSFATILKQIGTSTDVISELMGHSDVQITMTYLKEFDKEHLDNENRKLMDL